MKAIHLGIGVIVSLSFSLQSQANLSQRVNEEVAAGKAYPCASTECPTPNQISDYQFFFVDGFLGQKKGRNFVPIRNVLKNQFGVDDFHFILPSSAKSMSANSEVLYQTIFKLRAQSPHKKAIIVSHSKGGGESLLMALRHPDLLTSGLVTDIVLVDGAFNGTPLANLWVDVCHLGKTERIRKQDKDFCKIVAGWADGVNSLKPSHVKPVVAEALSKLSQGDKEYLNYHLWSIQSLFGGLKSEWSSLLLTTHYYLSAIYGENDGVILTAEENLPATLGIGRSLGTFSSDHQALLSERSTQANNVVREGFARALVREMVLQSQ